MRSPMVTALVHPLNLFMLAAAVVAGLISAWWMFPLGLFLWLVMVIVVSRDPALRLNVDKDRRDTLAQRFQEYFSRIERAQVSVFNSLSNAPAPVRRAMQPVQDELGRLVDRTYAFCQRMTNLDNYRMVAESQRNLDQDLKRVEETLSRTQDPIIRQEYEESKRALEARLGDRLALIRQLDRVEAQLLGLANETDRIVADVLRLQAVGGKEAERRASQLVRRLRQEQSELARFEQEALQHRQG
jgi:hypothetical protein